MNVENKKISVFEITNNRDLTEDRNRKFKRIISITLIITITNKYYKMNHD